MQDQVFTLGALEAAYAAGLRPEAVVAEAFRRIAAAEDPGIFLHLADQAEVMAQARALGAHDPGRPLWGIPFAVKDNIDVAGMPTTAACPAFAYVARRDAFVVARLRAAGALVIGKTNLDQFATGLVGVRTPHPVPRNALDPAIVPGGSSSGSAVAVARGIVSFALGTDTAGSGRVPAALNNIVGLKPSLGALSAGGVVPACRTLDSVSVFALTVGDAYAAFRAAAGYDAADAFSRRVAVPPLAAPPPVVRIGIPDRASIRFNGDAAQEASFRAAVAALAAAGAEVAEIDFAPFFAVAEMLYEGAWVAERHTVIGDLMARDPEAVHPVTRAIVGTAEALSAADAFRGIYRLEELRRAAEPTLAGLDMLCVPSIPTFVTCAQIAADPVGPNSMLGTYTNFVNLMNLCGIAVPTGPRADGRPGGVTLLASAGRDALVAAVAGGLERAGGGRHLGATGWPVPAPAPLPARALPGEIEIAVCGAHMSGMALNGELAGLGARFLRAARTTSDYRLYVLPGGPPARPGLVRVGDGAGGPVAVEVWAMPEAAVGRFLAAIPAPLGLGTLRLGDGSAPKGFLCEAAGAAGAEDVTALGDWRAVVARDAAQGARA